ncbi:hypothetical protein ABLN97_04845 [Mycobacterium tuberculosis]
MPRGAVLRRQLDRLKARGLVADVATELEFIVFDQLHRQAWASGYRGLTPASDYNIDYAICRASSRMEPLLRDTSGWVWPVRVCDSRRVKGECNMGQQEIGFVTTRRWSPATTMRSTRTAPRKSPTSTARAQRSWRNTMNAKVIAVTSMSRCVARDGSAVFADSNGPHGMSSMFRSFVAGQLATLREFTLCYAPTINSYKRFADRQFAPTALACGLDNRTCALRGGWPRAKHLGRMPGSRGGDVKPVPGGGGSHCWRVVRHESGAFSCLSPVSATGLPRRRCRTAAGQRADAAVLFEDSALVREAFGEDVVARTT